MICRLQCLPLDLVRRLARCANREGTTTQELVAEAVREMVTAYEAEERRAERAAALRDGE